MRNRGTGRNTLIVASLSLVSAILGFAREWFIAFEYGANGTTDAFYIALIIPDMIAGWISYALTNAVVPTLKERLSKSAEDVNRLIWSVLWDTFIVLLAISLFGFRFTGVLSKLLAPGSPLTTLHLSASMLNIMLWSVVFSGLTGVLWGIHNALESYAFPALIGVIYNFIFILFAWASNAFLGVYSLSYAFLAGVIGRFLIQFIPLLLSQRIKFQFLLWHSDLKSVARLMMPVLLSTGVSSLSVVIDRVLASGLGAGQISDLNYASKIGLLPVTVIGGSLATTLYTRFLNATLQGNAVELKRLLGIGTSWVVIISSVVFSGFVLLPSQIIALLFLHGAFPLRDVYIASAPLRVYGIFSASYLVIPIFTHFLFSQKAHRFVTRSSLFAVSCNIILSVVLVHPYGIVGLTLANGIAQTVYAIIMATYASKMLNTRMGRVWGRPIIETVPPSFALFLGVLFVVWTFQHLHWNILTVPREVEEGAIALVAGISLWTISASLFHNTAPAVVVETIITKFRSRVVPK